MRVGTRRLGRSPAIRLSAVHREDYNHQIMYQPTLLQLIYSYAISTVAIGGSWLLAY